MAAGSRSYEILEEVRQLRLLVARQVELLESIRDIQTRIEHEIARGLQ